MICNEVTVKKLYYFWRLWDIL